MYADRVLERDAVIAAAWRDGVGPEERELFEAMSCETTSEVALFAALCRLLAGEHAMVPSITTDPPTVAVHAAAEALAATLARDAEAIDRAVESLAQALDAVDDADPRATPARSWADLALAEIALAVGDSRVAEQRFNAAAAPGNPVALRIAAMLQLVRLAVERRDLEAARTWARKAARAGDEASRPLQCAHARRITALLDYACGDTPALRESAGDDAISRILLATLESPSRAMVLLADAVREAAERGDALSYALCVLTGARRCLALGRGDDAHAMLAAAAERLRNIAPHLAKFLDEERRSLGAT